MAANKILKETAPHYHRFEDNQVLTDEALNRVLDHINYQDKLTRTGLIGVGILCGLKVRTSGDSIILEKGIAVTTDGDILYKPKTEYKGFKKFADENVLYETFLVDDKVMDLYELEEDTTSSNVFSLDKFHSKTDIDEENMVALLYLENFHKDEDDCSGIDCNAQGLEVVNNLRVLVTSQENARKIASEDSILNAFLNDSGENIVSNLDQFLAKKVILNSGNTSSLSSLKAAYEINFLDLSVHIERIGELQIFKDIAEGNSFNSSQLLQNLKTGNLTFQYTYDLYKDLVNAYNELLEQLRRNYTICCADFAAFPKHVLLGEIHHMPVSLRHSFYASPIHDYSSTIKNLKDRYKRILKMLQNFAIERHDEIRITPSRNGYHSLGERALPFYYNLKKSADPAEMLNLWRINNKGKTWNYYKHNYPSPIFDPLDYCLEDHDFYRIEGHVGHEVKNTLKNLENLRKEKGLDFKIVPVAIGNMADELTIDYEDFKAQFEDLQIILQAWNEEQKCMMKSASGFLSRFSTTQKGLHLDYMEVMPSLDQPNEEVENINIPGRDTGGFIARNFFMKEAGTRSLLFNQPKSKKQKNTILSFMDKSTDSTGILWSKGSDAIKTGDSGSAINVKIGNALKDKVRDWEEELQIAVMDIPASVLGKLKATEDNELSNISDFTEENLKKYLQALNEQCKTARAAKKKLQKQLLKDGSRLKNSAYIENYFSVLNRILSNCCLGEKVTILYKEILERKNELLNQFILRNYIDAHPGAQHKAGVPKGGTFILLYYSQAQRKKFDPERFIKLNMMTAEHLPEMSAERITTEGLGMSPSQPFSTGIRTRDIAAFDEDIRERIPEFGFSDLINLSRPNTLAHGTVIGDLCLPYVCCSETPALSFVFPDPVVSLFIGRDHVCVSETEEADELLLEVSPADAVLKAFIENKPVANLVSNNGDNWFFDPNKVENIQYGKNISFTVNDQKVPETIKVLEQPEPAFTISPDIKFNNQHTVANIKVENTSKAIENQNFHWNFSPFGETTNNAISFEFPIKVRPGQQLNLKISLTATNGPCSKTLDQELTINVPQEEANACLDMAKTDITNSLQILRTFLKKNSRQIVQFQQFYQDKVFAMYKLILSEPEETLDGKHDAEIFKLIQEIQHTIFKMTRDRLNTTQQAFLQIIYYETMFVYFYIQSCRDAAIVARTDITRNWPSFTKHSIARWKKGTRVMLGVDPVSEKIKIIRNQLKEQISNPLLKTLSQISEMLNSDFD